jgi:hypothetical protein
LFLLAMLGNWKAIAIEVFDLVEIAEAKTRVW